MPELPEVVALAADLARRLEGRAIAAAQLATFSALKTFDPPLESLRGLLVDGVDRHGKFLDLSAGDLHLVLHLARGGWVRWKDTQPSAPPRPSGRNPLALRVTLDDDSGFDVTEAGTQKRLAIHVVRDLADVPGIARLGPDPLAPDFDVDTLRRVLHDAGRAQIKGVLRDQSRLAGIGNAYSDEILHVARLSPFSPASTVLESASETLYDAMHQTLADAVARSTGLAAADLKGEKKSGMRVHGRTGQACPVCGDTVAEVSFADSSLQYCPTCQTGGQRLADRRTSKFLK